MRVERFPVYPSGEKVEAGSNACLKLDFTMAEVLRMGVVYRDSPEALKTIGKEKYSYGIEAVMDIIKPEFRQTLEAGFKTGYRAYKRHFNGIEEYLGAPRYHTRRYQEEGRLDPTRIAYSRLGETDIFSKRIKTQDKPRIQVVLDGQCSASEQRQVKTRALTAFALIEALQELSLDCECSMVNYSARNGNSTNEVHSEYQNPVRAKNIRKIFNANGIQTEGYELVDFSIKGNADYKFHQSGGMYGNSKHHGTLVCLDITQSGVPSVSNALISENAEFNYGASWLCAEQPFIGQTNGMSTSPTYRQLQYAYPNSDIVICLTKEGRGGATEQTNPVTNLNQRFLFCGVDFERDIPRETANFMKLVREYFG